MLEIIFGIIVLILLVALVIKGAHLVLILRGDGANRVPISVAGGWPGWEQDMSVINETKKSGKTHTATILEEKQWKKKSEP